MSEHRFPVRVYYEDTDLSGAVYHANYLKFFERAREHYIGPELLAELWNERELGFVVYEANLRFKRSARLADELEVRSTVERDSDYRVTFHQSVWMKDGDAPLVEGTIELVCVEKNGELTELPGVIEVRD